MRQHNRTFDDETLNNFVRQGT